MFGWLRILAIIFFPLPLLYTFIIYLRNKFYDWNWFKSDKLPAPVISVGNIQLGGTGKTPLVQLLANWLCNQGYQPVILTRGYKRHSQHTVIIDENNRDSLTVSEVGDEPLLLARNLPGMTIAVDAQRQRAAQEVLKKKLDVIFVLDDGFQHRQLKRQLDLVLLDSSRWSNIPLLFPLTSFRDLPSSLRRAQAIILINTSNDPQKSQEIKREIFSKWRIPVFFGEHYPLAVKNIMGETSLNFAALKNKKIAAFCGIAQPISFFNLLKNLEAQPQWRKIFPDHYAYRQKDVDWLWEKAVASGVDCILTTQKDAVKIASLKIPSAPQWYFLQIGFEIAEKTEFFTVLKNSIQKSRK